MLPFFRLIDEQADHMRSLIRDLLDAGSIEAGTLSVTPEPSDVKDLADQARTTFLGGGSRHAVLIDLPPDLPRVMADRPRIVQVLNNLLANAARHSPEASPIRVAAELDDVHVSISVSDEGRGLSAEELPRLFQKHTNVDGAEDRGLRGTGLGLAICKGTGGGPRRPHMGGQRRCRPGRPIHFFRSGGRRGRRPRRGRRRPAPGSPRTRAHTHPGGGRRPAGPALHAGDSRGRGLRPDRDPGCARLVTASCAPRKPQLVLLDLMLPETTTASN